MSKGPDISIDQARKPLAHCLGADAELVRQTWTQIVDEDVRFAHQLEHARKPFGALHVDRDAALVAVHLMEERRVVPPERWTPAAGIVTAFGSLDLEHLGAHIGQDLRRIGRGEDLPKFQNPDAGEKHYFFLAAWFFRAA